MKHSNIYPFKSAPYKHQLDVFIKSRDKKEYALFMEMGTGKSKVIIDTVAYLYDNNKIDTLVVIAPKGAYKNWYYNEVPTHMADHVLYDMAFWSSNLRKKEKEELNRLLEKSGRLKILLFNVEALSTKRAYLWLEGFLSNKKALICVDESTKIKNPRAKRTKSIIYLAKDSDYRRILTGEPVTKSPLDLYSQCHFLNENLLGFSSFYTFRNRYAIMMDMRAGNRSFKKIVGYKKTDELSGLLSKFSFRVKKVDCLDLPPKTYQYRYVDLTSEQAKAYLEMKQLCITSLENTVITAQSVLTQLTKLHQIVCGHVLDSEGNLNYINNNRLPALLELLDESDDKAIIWACYRADIQEIAKAIEEKYGDVYVTYYGDTTQKDRDIGVTKFQNDKKTRFFIANPATAGFGLNLHAANLVVYYSNNYDLEHRLQSEDRAHRIGQKKSVAYIDLITKNTVDARIITALKQKKKIANLIMKDEWKEWLQ